MSNRIFDESLEINRILSTGFRGKTFNFKDIYYLAKYYLYIKGFGDSKTYKALVEFSLRHDRSFNEIKIGNKIKKAIAQAKQAEIKKDNLITIYQKEIERIQTVKDFKIQKVLLAMLAFAKKAKPERAYRYLVPIKNISHIKAISKTNLTVKTILNLRYSFYVMGLIDAYKDKIVILYANNNKSEKIAFEVESIDDLIDQYISYCGGELKYCVNCKNKMIKTANRQEYCGECSKLIRREKVRRNVKKHRNKSVINKEQKMYNDGEV